MNTQAIVRGADALPRRYETVVDMLADAAARAPHAEAVVCEDRRLSYRVYLRCVAGLNQAAAVLALRSTLR